MDTLTEYAERMWQGEATMRGLFADGAPMGVAAPVADGVAVVPGFANVIAFQTADGLVLVDTGLQQTAQAMFDARRHPHEQVAGGGTTPVPSATVRRRLWPR